MLLTWVILTFTFFVLLFKKFLGRNANYWKERGVVTLESETTLLQLLTAKKSPVDADRVYYDQLGGGKFGGSFEFGNPMLFLKDLEVVKHILIKDFDRFMDHRDFVDTDPVFSKSLFFLHTGEWRNMRAFLSPTFTSGKIRRMFHHFERCSNRMKDFVHANSTSLDNGYAITVPDVMGRFTADVIGAVAFGMETDALTNLDSFFFKMAKRSVALDKKRLLKFGLFSFFPKIGNYFRMQSLPKDVSDFFLGILTKAFLEREANNKEGREDFLQILTEAKAENKTGIDFTVDLAIQQAFLFFLAGFDTVAGGLSTTSYLLALHPEVQQKLWKEINEAMVDGKMSYEAVNKLEYMEMVFSEILRMYPPVQRIERKCTQDYPMPGGNFTVPKGMIVGIPVGSIHYDPKYYPNPEQFLPGRFSPENKANRNPHAYLPFGIGPRNCIGMRFALIEVKVALAYLLYNFKVEPIEGLTPVPVEMWTQFGFTRVKQDLQLKLVPRT